MPDDLPEQQNWPEKPIENNDAQEPIIKPESAVDGHDTHDFVAFDHETHEPITLEPVTLEPIAYTAQPQLAHEIQAVPEKPKKIRRIPNLGDTALFFVIAVVLIGIGQLIGVLALHLFFPHSNTATLLRFSATDARASIPIQAFAYALIALVSVPVFTVMWNRTFGDGVHWNNAAANRRFFRLVLLGLAAGAFIALIGNLLPMPKNPPITRDMMKTAAGAWIMLVFGVTVAPLLEELAFRGFLLPGFINFFRWTGGLASIEERKMDRFGVPVAILLTSVAFAFMHSPQVSHAWGPLVLIGFVSIILCVVRLLLKSVAAGMVVHAAYNLTLFVGVLYQTGGFRHLDKLT